MSWLSVLAGACFKGRQGGGVWGRGGWGGANLSFLVCICAVLIGEGGWGVGYASLGLRVCECMCAL